VKHVTAQDLLVQRVLRLFAPPPRLSLADWSAENFRLAERASSEPGRFTPWPYQRFILDAIGDPAIERVTVLKAARVGFTKCLMAAIGASAATRPSSIILLVPTDDDARGFAVDEIEPAFQESPALAGLLRTGRNDGRNTMVMKALSISTPIPTPSGWTAMGDLRVGDSVFDETGTPCTVEAVSEIGNEQQCFRVVFSDGSEIVADAGHLWQVDRWRIKRSGGIPVQSRVTEILTTADLVDRQVASGRKAYSIPVAEPLRCQPVTLPVDPYILGAWLGDGLSHRAAIVANSRDAEMVDLMSARGALTSVLLSARGLLTIALEPGPRSRAVCSRGHARVGPFRRGSGCSECRRQRDRSSGYSDAVVPTIRSGLSALGLLKDAGRAGGESRKAIPAVYLRASYEQRMDLLRGLMDTDGSLGQKGSARFYTSLPALAAGFGELLASLGFKFTVSTRAAHSRGKQVRDAFTFVFATTSDRPVFALARKREKQIAEAPAGRIAGLRRRIVSVEPIASVPVRCIAVSSPSRLYLAGPTMVPTHNSFLGGGSLKILAARSPRNLRRHDAKTLFIDEADGMEVTVEGDPIALAIKRTFAHADRKIVMGSTPTLENVSNVEKSWKTSNQSVFECPCPRCGGFFELQWEQLRWPAGEPAKAHLVCPACDQAIEHVRKADMINEMRVRATRPQVLDHAGFRLSALISLFANAAWGKLAAEFEQARKAGPSEMQVFTNTVLGRPYRLSQAMVDEDTLLARAEPFGLAYDRENGRWEAIVPPETLYITAGVDVQHDRLEVGLWGWCEGGVQALGHEILTGDTAFPEVWAELDVLLQQRWQHPFGATIGIEAACIDAGDSSGRQRSERLMEFSMGRHGSCRTYAVKGASNPQSEPVKRATKLKMRGRLWLVSVDQFKADLWSRLELLEPGPGWMRFSALQDLEWFKQLLAEPPQIVYRRGRPEREFVRIPNRRAEVLDCFVYAAAARHFFRPDWARRAADLTVATSGASGVPQPKSTVTKARELAELLRRK